MPTTITAVCHRCGTRYQMSPEREDCPCCGCDGRENDPTHSLADERDDDRAAIDCPACGQRVEQVASVALSLALWQHYQWVCLKTAIAPPNAGTEQEP